MIKLNYFVQRSTILLTFSRKNIVKYYSYVGIYVYIIHIYSISFFDYLELCIFFSQFLLLQHSCLISMQTTEKNKPVTLALIHIFVSVYRVPFSNIYALCILVRVESSLNLSPCISASYWHFYFVKLIIPLINSTLCQIPAYYIRCNFDFAYIAMLSIFYNLIIIIKFQYVI